MIGVLPVLFDGAVNVALRELLPEFVVRALHWLTHLGDNAGLIGLTVALYWFAAPEHRDRFAFVIAVGLAGLALVVGLKGLYQFPRPELAFSPTGYPGYGFPSGHALASAAFYITLAGVLTRGSRGTRYLLAALLVTVISISRLAIGVHYPGDVLAGVALGVGLAAVALWGTTRDPMVWFALAAAIAVGGAILGSQEYVAPAVGGSIGALVGWYLVRNRTGTSNEAALVLFALACLPPVLVVGAIAATTPVPPTAQLVGAAALGCGAIVAPVVATAFDDRSTTRTVQAALPVEERSGRERIDRSP